MKNKVIPLLLVVIAGLAVGWGVYIYNQNRAPTSTDSQTTTSDWKTYTNDKFGLSFKYPSYLTATSRGPTVDGQSGTFQLPLDTIFFKDNNKQEYFSVMIFPQRADPIASGSYKNSYLSLGSHCDNRFDEDPSQAEEKIIVKNGVKILEVKTYSNPGDSHTWNYLRCDYLKNFSNNLIVFNLVRTTDIHNKAEYEVKYADDNAILDSILNTVSIEDIANQNNNLQTYTNNQYGFSIQYPANASVNNVNLYESYYGPPHRIDLYTAATFKLTPSSRTLTGIDYAQLSIQVATTSLAVQSCANPYFAEGPSEHTLSKPPVSKTINGVTYTVTETSDAASGGQRAAVIWYSTTIKSECYVLDAEVSYRSVDFSHSATDGSHASQAELQAQKSSIDQAKKELEDMISTFKFNG